MEIHQTVHKMICWLLAFKLAKKLNDFNDVSFTKTTFLFDIMSGQDYVFETS